VINERDHFLAEVYHGVATSSGIGRAHVHAQVLPTWPVVAVESILNVFPLFDWARKQFIE
jgi:hypothetical protein